MSRPIRVLMADDSLVIRRILSQALSRHADLAVAAMGRTGREAVDLLDSAKPDVVLLDVEMPVMTGVEAAAAIRKRDATLPILMFSSLTVEGGQSTLDALAKGATDYVPKPRNMVSLEESLEFIETELISKILFWGRKRQAGNQPAAPMLAKPFVPAASRAVPRDPPEILVIGVSTGGPNALSEVLAALPATFPLPVLIVQHMPPVFTGLLAARLDQVCPLTVREAVEGDAILPGQVLLAPGNKHLRLKMQEGELRCALDEGPLVNSCRPAVDVLFQSVAEHYGSRVFATVLTGMGKDGKDGAQAIKSRLGRVIVQDQETCVVWGMPRAVQEAGLADKVLPLSQIAGEIVAATAAPRRPVLHR